LSKNPITAIGKQSVGAEPIQLGTADQLDQHENPKFKNVDLFATLKPEQSGAALYVGERFGCQAATQPGCGKVCRAAERPIFRQFWLKTLFSCEQVKPPIRLFVPQPSSTRDTLLRKVRDVRVLAKNERPSPLDERRTAVYGQHKISLVLQ
jgi:hypothetical protein